jgi:hypothetical protein
MTTLLETLASSITSAIKVNASVQAQPAVILWTDSERQWGVAIKSLREIGLTIFELGDYAPEQNTGPAIWLKSELAKFAAKEGVESAVLYLPGVSRNDLRAIESCPRHLQPLAELQYRGVYWSQVNGKDWTVNAILTSGNGGLGLKVAQDRLTYQAQVRVLNAGELLNKQVVDFENQTLDATYFDSLIAPNPTRDVLAWMNDTEGKRKEWAGSHWDVFTSNCRKDFGFKPEQDGVMTAVEKLITQEGKWKAVWENYVDSFSSFPNVLELLERVAPPSDMFADRSGYPQVNTTEEQILRQRFVEVGKLPTNQAREALLECEKQHAERRNWLWAKMGKSPLVNALEHLAKLAELSTLPLKSSKLQELSVQYTDTLWQIDSAAIMALAAVTTKIDSQAVEAALKSVYVPWLEEGAKCFQQAVRDNGGFGHKPHSEAPTPGLCVIFVDGLRFDVARLLVPKLEKANIKAVLDSKWTSIPSVTASGKAWVSPVASLIQGSANNKDFEPNVSADGKPLSSYNFKKLLVDSDWQVLGRDELGDPAGSAWTECGDLDHFGHEHGLKLAKEIPNQLAHITERILELLDAGWKSVRIVTDHGWLLVPGGLPKVELSQFEAETRWGRCAVLKDSSKGTSLTFAWDWCADVQIAMAPGISSFIAGNDYSHGGLSLQESLVPVIEIMNQHPAAKKKTVTIKKVSWVGLRCHIEIEPMQDGLMADIRTKAAVADSTVAASPKAIEQGKASLVVPDDELIGTAAIVVILDNAGNVVQKAATTIGE